MDRKRLHTNGTPSSSHRNPNLNIAFTTRSSSSSSSFQITFARNMLDCTTFKFNWLPSRDDAPLNSTRRDGAERRKNILEKKCQKPEPSETRWRNMNFNSLNHYPWINKSHNFNLPYHVHRLAGCCGALRPCRLGPPRRCAYIQIIKYTLYMTNLTFQKEGSQFHWMYDLINEFYTQPYCVPLSCSVSLPLQVELLQSSNIWTFFFCWFASPSLASSIYFLPCSTSWFYYGEY